MMTKKLFALMMAATAFTSFSAHAERIPGEVPLKPYAYGTVGAARDHLQMPMMNDRDVRTTGQVGVGVQLNEFVGGEIYYQGGSKFKYKGQDGATERVRAQSVGTRATIGTSTQNPVRVFAKVGVAATRHNGDEWEATRPQFTAGVGATYNVSNNFAVRGDYDHQFKRHSSVDRKGSDYVGVGGQVSF